MVAGLAIFPISLLGNGVLGPLLSSAPLVVRTLVFTTLFSILMTYLALPTTTRLLRGWLHPPPPSDERHSADRNRHSP